MKLMGGNMTVTNWHSSFRCWRKRNSHQRLVTDRWTNLWQPVFTTHCLDSGFRSGLSYDQSVCVSCQKSALAGQKRGPYVSTMLTVLWFSDHRMTFVQAAHIFSFIYKIPIFSSILNLNYSQGKFSVSPAGGFSLPKISPMPCLNV